MSAAPILGGARFHAYPLSQICSADLSIEKERAYQKKIAELESQLKKKDADIAHLKEELHGPTVEAEIKVCPECGAPVTYTYSPSEQEYPGASIWPEQHYWECTECGWDKPQKGGCINGQENKRGW